MSSLLSFEREKFGVIFVETEAARKEVPTGSLKETWASLEVSKIAPEESLVEVKAAFEELYSNYFAKERTPAQGNQVYSWYSWNLLLGFNEILQQVKAMANCEIEALRARDEKSVEIMAFGEMTIKCCPIKLPPWRQSSLKLCHRKVTTIRVKGKIMHLFNSVIR
ncbi:hypothetical protein DSO57_1000171 [Entomophthora muscae]|uniref:Uncharacterized protein n=1 Tax=Entomophthora muscae TaxID=34485 RepID=A0ACC2T9Q3_9FUNG|nr:hypothetical protein DSO57_1000171 [Entomophthora muscae]